MCEETIRQKSAKELAAELVRFDSVSSKSNSEVTQTVSGWLDQLGFQIEWLEYKDSQGTTKVSIVAKREPKAGVKGPEGNATGGGAYLAHTDVVPVDDWDTGFSGPFEPIEREGRLYGRGSCDMKGSLACAIQAVSRIDRNQQIKPLYFVVTADEEIGMEGAYRVDKQSKLFQEMIDSRVTGIIGEPTEMKVVVAHKGTWEVVLRANGTSAHTSTGAGRNANYQLIPALAPLLALRERTETSPEFQNKDFDPPTLSWNMVIRNEPLALNVTTAIAEVPIFLRTMPGVDVAPIMDEIRRVQQAHGLEWIEKRSNPFWRVEPKSAWVEDMLKITGTEKPHSVCYGTDASQLQRLERLVICGPGSIDQAHRKDEWVAIEQLERAVHVFEQAFRKWAC